MAKSQQPNANPPNFHTGSSSREEPSPVIQALVRLWLTVQEAKDIYQRFQKSCVRNRQVLWSGMNRETAQRWADKHNFQTLTTALGPLLDPSDPGCPHHLKPSAGWSGYIHGASVIFAWYISQGDLVTVLSQPPPQRFHPSGKTYYQTVEEPIVKGMMGNRPVKKILVVHPTVGGQAEEFKYEMWPHDEFSLWTKNFGIQHVVTCWRAIKTENNLQVTKVLKMSGEPSVAPVVKSTASNAQKTESKTVEKGGKNGKKKKKQTKNSKGWASFAESSIKEKQIGKQQSAAVIRPTRTKKKNAGDSGQWTY